VFGEKPVQAATRGRARALFIGDHHADTPRPVCPCSEDAAGEKSAAGQRGKLGLQMSPMFSNFLHGAPINGVVHRRSQETAPTRRASHCTPRARRPETMAVRLLTSIVFIYIGIL
jgi:hypothetical protein